MNIGERKEISEISGYFTKSKKKVNYKCKYSLTYWFYFL